MSWVTSAMERSKAMQRENLPAWRYDPRVAAGNHDASLNALAVITADRLIAVGDRGLILQSTDAGRTWHAQKSLTSLNLYGVTFVNEQLGIAVGGTIQPLSQSSVGIVLVTTDGGNTWQAVSESSQAPLPRLTGVSQNERSLRAWGDYSNAHQSGVFESQDQGQTWSPVAVPLGHMQSVAAQPHGLVLGLDRAGRLGQVPLNPQRALTQLAPPQAPVHALAFANQQWVAVGDSGTLASSKDGAVWVDHSLPLSQSARDVCSFRCIAAQDENLWVAGTPGSILVHSPDAGRTWRVVPIVQSWSISAVRFIDRNRGWLVTSGGSIWATRDGGTSWFAQRVPVKRLGLQSFATSAANIAWPALANAAWQARQAAELVVLERQTPEDTVAFTPDEPATLNVLGTQIGLSAVWNPSQWTSMQVAIREPSARANLINYLATHIRAGRPTAVLIDDLAGSVAHDESFTEIVMQAMWLAENESVNSTWLSHELHLAPWKTTKLMSITTPNRADFTISSEELLRDSGLAMQDVLAPLFGKQSLALPGSCVHCLQIHSGNSASRQSLLANHDKSIDSTRAVELSKIGNLQLVMGRAPRDKAWQALAPTSLNADEDMDAWTKKLDSVIQQTPKHECGAMLLRLADQCLSDNRWDRWTATLQRTATLVPLSDCSRHAGLQLLRMTASEEFLAWQAQATNSSEGDVNEPDQANAGPLRLASSSKIKRLGNALDSTPFDAPPEMSPTLSPAVSPAVATQQIPAGLPTSIQTASAEAAIEPQVWKRASALKQSVNEFNRVVEADRALAARPDVLLTHYARRRVLSELSGEPAPDASPLQALSGRTSLAGWPQVGAQEFMLAGGRAERTNWSARVARTHEAPALNGIADDACWQTASAIELVNPFLPPIVSNQKGRTTAQVRLAYDHEFLYGHITCPNVSGIKPASSEADKERRRYDMDLQGTDHVVLYLDTDRDYSSANQLAINRAGHTYDRCCQYSQWNPRWYVDVQDNGSMWSAEFAIRLSDLTTRPPESGSAWAMSAFRYVPNWGTQSWSQLRTQTPQPQGNGLLVFE